MLRTIGLMSGTSLDGVDAAWLETDGVRIGRFGPRLTLPYSGGFRAELRMICDLAPALTSTDARLAGAVARITDHHARAVASLGEAADLIGFHGQTILHRPAERRTWQIGDATRLASITGTRTAYNFRVADVAAGGEGAPLAPVFHRALAATLAKPLAVLNIGGVANLTWLARSGEMVAFDTGPGNGLLDDWIKRRTGAPIDRDGAIARAGRVDGTALAKLMDDPYFERPYPKSLDRLDFSARLAASGLDRLSTADGAATLVAFTARAVEKAAAAFPEPPRRWLVSGGGRHNPVIMQALRDALASPVEPVEAVGWDGDCLEAQCFGFLAARVAAGLPLTFPTTTGVSRPLPGGTIADVGVRDSTRHSR